MAKEHTQAIPLWRSLVGRAMVGAGVVPLVGIPLVVFFVARAARSFLSPADYELFLREVYSIGGAAVLFFVAVSLVLMLIFSRRVTRTMDLLRDAMRRIAAGDFTSRVPVYRNDELGTLAKLFNTMVDSFADSQARIHALTQVKSQFVTVAAHQLRTPLSAMRWTLRLLLDDESGTLTQKQREFLEQGYQTNSRMIHLVNDFLDISRIEEGRFGFHFGKTRVVDIIQRAVKEASMEAEATGVKIRFESLVPDDLAIIMDEERIYTALMNILDNAVRYNKKGGSVTVAAARTGDMLEVRVTDTGIGIPKDEHQRIFSRFYRASNALRYKTEGSGLGLYIVRAIIYRHGGQVSFTSAEGKGTTILFTLPVREDFVRKETEQPFKEIENL